MTIIAFLLIAGSVLPLRFGEGAAGGEADDAVATSRHTDRLLVNRLDLAAPFPRFFVGSRGGDRSAGRKHGFGFWNELVAAVSDVDAEAGRGVGNLDLGVVAFAFRQRLGNVGGGGAGGEREQPRQNGVLR